MKKRSFTITAFVILFAGVMSHTDVIPYAYSLAIHDDTGRTIDASSLESEPSLSSFAKYVVNDDEEDEADDDI